MWNPEAQHALLSGSNPNVSQNDLGTLLVQKQPQTTPDQTLFFQSYVNPTAAKTDLAAASKNVNQTVETALKAAPITVIERLELQQLRCEVFPPLLVRYAGTYDTYIPCILTTSSEIHRTAQKPMLILNFHAQSTSITLTICDIDRLHMPTLQLALRVLYAMKAPDALSLEQFTTLYDSVRMSFLRSSRV